ncbi:LLM class F420-dependent oxidoreductase [soil metagenome]
MRIALAGGISVPEHVDLVVEAERLGASSVWLPELWGADALTPLAYLAARTSSIGLATGIVQLGSRSPALLAMTAMTMQQLSGGRFLLGLGTSGPQVMEGWHGVRFTAPVSATRETIEIIRTVARGDRLTHDGRVYQVPLPDGPGRPMRSMLQPVDMPVYVAALGPRNLELTGELADGWLGNAFLPEHAGAFLEPLRTGAARRGVTLDHLDLVIPVAVEITDDADEAASRHARGYAFTIGAMGLPGQNFYNDAFARQGFADDVAAVQSLWLAGKREEAAARVPVDLGAKTNLLGPPDVIKDRLRRYRDAGITTLQAKLEGPIDQRLATLAHLLELAADVDAEHSA